MIMLIEMTTFPLQVRMKERKKENKKIYIY